MLLWKLRSVMPMFEGDTGTSGGGGGGTAPPAGTPAGTPPPQPPPAPPAAATPPTGQNGPGGAEPKMFSREYVQELREEAAGLRVKLREEREAWKALGTDPAAVKAQFDALHGTVRTLKVDGALGGVFAKYKVDPDLTRKVLATDAEYGKLDPDHTDFGKSLEAIVKAAADKYPQLKAGQAPPPVPPAPRGSLDLTGGGQQSPAQLTREQLKTMTPDQIAEATRRGEFDQVLGRKP